MGNKAMPTAREVVERTRIPCELLCSARVDNFCGPWELVRTQVQIFDDNTVTGNLVGEAEVFVDNQVMLKLYVPGFAN